MKDLPGKLITQSILGVRTIIDSDGDHQLSIEQFDEIFRRCKAEPKLRNALEKHLWIPVSERLPKNIADVWIVLKAKATNSYAVGVGFYGECENGWGWEIYGNGLLTEVAYWKPIIFPEEALENS